MAGTATPPPAAVFVVFGSAEKEGTISGQTFQHLFLPLSTLNSPLLYPETAESLASRREAAH